MFRSRLVHNFRGTPIPKYSTRTMSHKMAASIDPPPAVNEGFTEGALTIRSADGINFKAHSLFLSVASPLFSDLFKSGNNNEIFRFPENAEVLAVMLKFIYPKPTPIITSMNILNDAVRVAKIYQLDNMKTRLREQLVLVDSPVSVYSNPLGALSIAATHGFTPEAELAANLASKQFNFEKGQDLKRLVDAAQGPATAELVKLTGIPLVKTRVLVDTLFHFERSPMKLCNHIDALVCTNCREAFRNYSRQSPPEWQARWALWIFDEIKDRPISEWEPHFSPSNTRRAFCQSHLSLTTYTYRKGLEYRTCTCLDAISNPTNETALQNWVDGVYKHLISRLALVKELEAPVAHNSDQLMEEGRDDAQTIV
ncbi:unnamed protein product [Rhizoctonia solani]|uniref:BTB domain-containing protein n=1 Tax=Rhizoctonia solani TaxID=456999 RepID=A0A8H3H109_9AGAM|nr:unnamed protein product [Rhizoctonia solani]